MRDDNLGDCSETLWRNINKHDEPVPESVSVLRTGKNAAMGFSAFWLVVKQYNQCFDFGITLIIVSRQTTGME